MNKTYYANSDTGDALAHVKYVAKIDISPTKKRYFYSAQEYSNYLKGKGKNAVDSAKETLKGENYKKANDLRRAANVEKRVGDRIYNDAAGMEIQNFVRKSQTSGDTLKKFNEAGDHYNKSKAMNNSARKLEGTASYKVGKFKNDVSEAKKKITGRNVPEDKPVKSPYNFDKPFEERKSEWVKELDYHNLTRNEQEDRKNAIRKRQADHIRSQIDVSKYDHNDGRYNIVDKAREQVTGKLDADHVKKYKQEDVERYVKNISRANNKYGEELEAEGMAKYATKKLEDMNDNLLRNRIVKGKPVNLPDTFAYGKHDKLIRVPEHSEYRDGSIRFKDPIEKGSDKFKELQEAGYYYDSNTGDWFKPKRRR